MYDTPEERIFWIIKTLEFRLYAEEQYSNGRWWDFNRQYTPKIRKDGYGEKRICGI